jgi:selenocysteine lyase/cysteine desulfurase
MVDNTDAKERPIHPAGSTAGNGILPSQRAVFELPREISYLDAASWSPLPLATVEAGRAGVARKARPWTLEPGLAARQHQRARHAAARLVNASPSDIAIVSSVSYCVATAAKLLPVPAGSRVLVIEEDHSSPVLEWMTRSERGEFEVEVVPRPQTASWTEALLGAIDRRDAKPIALASISSVHWADGGVVDVAAIKAALRPHGAALLVDATHAAGVASIDVQGLDPDFLAFPTYKWLLGPYGRAFFYVAPRHQGGVPLEQTFFSRRDVGSDRRPYMRDLAYVAGAPRFDMGERDHFVSLEMAAIGMEMLTEWGLEAVAARLRMLTDRLAEGLRGLDVKIPEPRVRAPHILSLGFPHGMPEGLIAALAEKSCFAAARLGRLRISPHVYNDEEDVDRFVSALHRVLR